MSWTKEASDYFETSEEACRLMLGIVFSYPIFILYRATLTKMAPNVQHSFFILAGMGISYWSLGYKAVFHSSVCIFTTYLTMLVLGGTFYSTLLIFWFNFLYLLAGYYYTETETYDICWTMPHCVLCLRLIAVSMDVWDGTKDSSVLANDQKQNRITEFPSLLEMFSQAFFPGGYLIGPQFSMNRFRAFIRRNIDENLPSPNKYGFTRIALGVGYLLFHTRGSVLFPLEWVMTKEYAEMEYFKRAFWVFIWVKVMMSKYIGAWLLAEGSMILSGMAYSGRDEKGEVQYYAGANVVVSKWEFSARLQDLIESFNINTNKWSASYIYKRMRFMNSRYFSQGMTMLFLATWHGLHSGYYLTFFNEFLMLNFEKELKAILDQSDAVKKFFELPLSTPFCWILGKLYIVLFLPHCFIPFGLLTVNKYGPVVMASSIPMYTFFLGWPLWSIPLRKILLPKKSVENGDTKKRE